jgi:hypothetical protein
MERWETTEQIAEALARFEGTHASWRRPRAHGLVVNGEVAVWNVGAHYLPAAVMASVLGHDGSTAAFALSEQQLDVAIEALSPAEACLDYDHPNLLAWRAARGAQVVAVFIS